MRPRIWALPVADRDWNLEVLSIPLQACPSSSHPSPPSQPTFKRFTGPLPQYPIHWPPPSSPLWQPTIPLKNPESAINFFSTDIILIIMKYIQNPVTNACFGLTCSRLYKIHFAENGPTNMQFIARVWTEPIPESFRFQSVWYEPTIVRCVALYQLIEEFMSPGWTYDRRKGIYRRAEDIVREGEERKVEMERWDRERLVKLAVIRKVQEKAERMSVLRRKREIIEKRCENLVIALRRKKAAIRKKYHSALMPSEMDDDAFDKEAEKRKRKKVVKRARKRSN
ncbi:hypothetical protein IFR04_015316, partial [Cadophora malorum]